MAEKQCLLIRCDGPHCRSQLTLPGVRNLAEAAAQAAMQGWVMRDMCPKCRSDCCPVHMQAASLLAAQLRRLELVTDYDESHNVARELLEALSAHRDTGEGTVACPG